MELDLIQIDAFASKVFEGNPAAVAPLDDWLPDETLQAVAMENNLAETAYIKPGAEPGVYDLRWFTPTVEVELCGHATLASGAYLLTDVLKTADEVKFDTKWSGRLIVRRQADGGFAMDLPAHTVAEWTPPNEFLAAMAAAGVEIRECRQGGGFGLVQLASEAQVRSIKPPLPEIEVHVPSGCLIVTAAADETADLDFVSRMFGPGVGIPEDPVTGSAHCLLTPYWSAELNQESFSAFQASRRGGLVRCTLKGDRVQLEGRAQFYMRGTASI